MDSDSTRPLIVGVDGSPSSAHALHYAARLADALGRPLEVVTAWTSPRMTVLEIPLDQISERDATAVQDDAVRAVFGPAVPESLTRTVRRGSAASVLIDLGADAEMLVLGSRGDGGFAGLLLGSVSAACVRHAHCPVLVVRPDERAV